MTLNAIKTTSGYIVEGTDAIGKEVELFYGSDEARHYDSLRNYEEQYTKHQQFLDQRAKLPDPERDLYLTIFGSGDEPEDKALHTTLVEAQDARDGVSLDWSGHPVTVVLRLIDQGKSHRLRLVAGQLVDMGPVSYHLKSAHVTEVPVPADQPYQGRHVAQEPFDFGD